MGDNSPLQGLIFTSCLVVHLTHLVPVSNARPPPSLRIGSVFMDLEEDRSIHRAFADILKNVNGNSHILNGTRVDVATEFAQGNPFDAYQKTCYEMKLSVVAVFGSLSNVVDNSVESVCSKLHVPYLTTRLAGRRELLLERNRPPSSYAIYLGPSQDDLIQVVLDITLRLNWNSVGLITHKESGSLETSFLVEKFQQMLGASNVFWFDLKVPDIRPNLSALRNQGVQNFIIDVGAYLLKEFFRQALESGIVYRGSSFLITSLDFTSVDVNPLRHTGSNFVGLSLLNANPLEFAKNENRTLTKAMARNMMISHKSCLLYDGFHVFASAIEKFIHERDMLTPNASCGDSESPYNQGQLLYKEINKIDSRGLTGHLKFRKGFRENVDFNILRLDRTGYFSAIGKWRRNPDGRSKLDLDSNILKTLSRLELSSTHRSIPPTIKKHLLVETLPTFLPYVWVRNSTSKESQLRNGSSSSRTNPPDQTWSSSYYEGFLIDLMDKLAQDLGFTYSLQSSEEYGSLNEETGEWSGLIGKLVNQQVDIALTDLTINSLRSKVIDFSPPFESTEMTIIVKKSKKPSSATDDPLRKIELKLIDFWLPFSWQTWLSLLIAFVMTSLVIYVVARISPCERRNQRQQKCYDSSHAINSVSASVGPPVRSSRKCHPLDCDRGISEFVKENSTTQVICNSCQQETFSIVNSFWYVLATMFWQTHHIRPKAPSTRFLTVCWWTFCCFILLVYVVKLGRRTIYLPSVTSFLDEIGQQDYEHEDLMAFLEDHNTKVGVLVGQDTNFGMMLQTSHHPVYKKLRFKYVGDTQELLELKTVTDGIKRIFHDKNFGFILQSTMVDFLTLKGEECSRKLTRLNNHSGGGTTGKLFPGLSHLQHAVAFPKGSNIKELISHRMLVYQEDGTLNEFRSKWFGGMVNGVMPMMLDGGDLEETCSTKSESSMTSYNYTPPDDTILTEKLTCGPFIFLLGACIVSIILVLLEVASYACAKSTHHNKKCSRWQMFWTTLKAELLDSIGQGIHIKPWKTAAPSDHDKIDLCYSSTVSSSPQCSSKGGELTISSSSPSVEYSRVGRKTNNRKDIRSKPFVLNGGQAAITQGSTQALLKKNLSDD